MCRAQYNELRNYEMIEFPECLKYNQSNTNGTSLKISRDYKLSLDMLRVTLH